MMALTGEPGGRPVRAGTSVMDMGTGMWAALAVVLALRRRDQTGCGAHLTASLFETGLAWLPYQLTGHLATGQEPQKLGSGLAMLVPYQAFESADRPLVVSAGNDALWQCLCAELERPELAEDPELATNPGRFANRERVVAHPQTDAVGMLQPVEHDQIDDYRLPALPLRIDGWRPVPGSGPPSLGDADPLD